MVKAIKIPDLGTNTDEVKLVEWLKQEGDPVKRGDMLCEVETDKAVDELESVAEGTLLRQVVPAGTDIRSGTIIAYVGSPGEAIPDPEAAAPQQPDQAQTSQSPSKGGGAKRVSPVVRNLAKRHGVDLESISGSGPGGRITREDVISASQAKGDDTGGSTPESGEKETRLPKQQLSVARRVSRSNQEIPTIHLTATVDVTRMMKLRQRLGEETSRKPAYDSIFLYAVSRIITDYKNFRRHVSGDNVVVHETVDLCVAISRERELYTPVIREADKLSLEEIDVEVRGLAEKTRAGQLRPGDMAGGSLTVSNLGMFPVQSFNVVIPPEQSAALAVGAIEERPVVREGKIVPLPMATLVLSVDHRSINGGEAAEFIKQLKDTLEAL